MSTQLTLSAVEQLLAIEEIRRVKSRYAYSADHHNWDDFASTFAPDASFDEHDFPIACKPGTNEPVSKTMAAYLEAKASTGTQWPVIGRDAIRAQVSNGVGVGHTMVHHVFAPEVDLTSDTTADAVFRFESHHWFKEGEPVQYMHNFGSYHESFVRLHDDRWYIKEFRLNRMRVECS
jgi:hypothetical protein